MAALLLFKHFQNEHLKKKIKISSAVILSTFFCYYFCLQVQACWATHHHYRGWQSNLTLQLLLTIRTIVDSASTCVRLSTSQCHMHQEHKSAE